MMQGDAYKVPVCIFDEEHQVVTEDDVLDVEIMLHKLTKTYTKGELTFEAGVWLFPITQEESFAFPAADVRAQVRIKWKNGEVEGTDLGYVNVELSQSKVVL